MSDGTDCVFCRIAAGGIKARTVYEDDDAVAFEDMKPQAPVHILIIPRRHIPRVSDIGKRDEAIMGKLLRVAADIAAEKKISGSGYRLTVNCGRDAGQAVGHIHIHLMGGRRFAWPPG